MSLCHGFYLWFEVRQLGKNHPLRPSEREPEHSGEGAYTPGSSSLFWPSMTKFVLFKLLYYYNLCG